MKVSAKVLRAAMFAVAILLAGVPASTDTFAQTPAPATAALPEATVKALQEALNRQGIAVSVSGVLNDETRAAVRKYQSQHHLPVTGEPDKATLDKLGVTVAAAAPNAPTVAQAVPAPGAAPMPQMPTQQGQAGGGMMMNCPMMQGQMQGMMQMMQGMMQMMQMMQGQMQSGPMPPPAQMQPGQVMPTPKN